MMNRIIHPAWLAIAFLLCIGSAQGQGFDYSVSSTSGTYSSLTGAATIGSDNNWGYSRFRIPIGFSFGFNGTSFDSVSIEPRGIFKFNCESSIAVFHGAGCKSDSSGLTSTLSYLTEGIPGSRILKIQYTNCGYRLADTTEKIAYQVWLYEQDDKIEIRTGATTYPAYDSTYTGPTPLVGLINPLNNTTVNGLLLSGSAASPTSQAVGEGQGLVYLVAMPPTNRIYSFTPND